MKIKTLMLERDPGCKARPLLISNQAFPRQRWHVDIASRKETDLIRARLSSRSNLSVTKIICELEGVFFLVYDPDMPSVYDSGGYHFLDERLDLASFVDQAPLRPLIDLDGDSVPEFFMPSSDGMGAWLYRLF